MSLTSASNLSAPAVAPATTATPASVNVNSPGSVATLLNNLASVQYNPALMQQAILATLVDVTNGNLAIVDPTNPFIFLMEAACCTTAGFLEQSQANTRKQYPVASQTQQDLYLHMSDKDYINRFAIPATANFKFIFPKSDIINAMQYDILTGIKKIVIPRNTTVTIADITFSLQYPIEVRQLLHGGIQVVYDTAVLSPLQQLSTNDIPYQTIQSGTTEYLLFQAPLTQFSIESQNQTATQGKDFSLDVGITDQFYYARVYIKNANTGLWDEIATTHTAEVFDVNVLTAVLEVNPGTVNVSIPSIYTGTGLINTNVRVDIYQTKGNLNINLSNYAQSAFETVWLAIDPNDQTMYVAPLSNLSTVSIISDDVVSGGNDGVDFNTLREQVITNSVGPQNLPITSAQIQSALSLDNYDVILNVDNVTGRVFIATRAMPDPVDPGLITVANASIETLSSTISQMVTQDGVIDNGTSCTITPDTLYTSFNGLPSLLTAAQKNALLALPPDQLALTVTNGNYFFTPFHYVLDFNSNEFNLRPYYLNSPVINTKLFISENDSTLLQVATQSYGIVVTNTGYAIQIVTASGETFQTLPDHEIFVQLAFIPTGEIQRAYLNGTLTSVDSGTGERTYTFNLTTNYNIDSTNNLQLTNFLLFADETHVSGIPLDVKMDLIYSTSSPMGSQWVSSEVDTVVGGFLLPGDIVGITHEQLEIHFGDALQTLWNRARSVISTQTYQTYQAPVPWLYTKDIYQVDANGNAVTFDTNGNPVLTKLHSIGDPVLDIQGNPTYQHLVGENILDNNGLPIPVGSRDLLRQFDIMLIEGAYYFANDVIGVNYRNTLIATVVDWITNDLTAIQQQLLEQTRIYFYPKTTLGTISVMIPSGIVVNIPAAQTFTVELYVDELSYGNLDLRANLEKYTIETIAAALTKQTIAISDIQQSLKQSYASNVIDVEVSGLGGVVNNFPVISVVNNSDRCSIAKSLVANADGSMSVQENITINFTKFVVPNT